MAPDQFKDQPDDQAQADKADPSRANPDADAILVGLMARFGERLRRYVGRALTPPDNEDALQDIYARLVRMAQKDPPPDFNVTYVFKTADSVVRDLYRRRVSHHSRDHTGLEDSLMADAPSPFDQLRWRQNAELLRQAIKGLNRDERLVLMLHRIEGLKLSEISTKHRIPLRTVQRHLAEALAKCRHKLKHSGWYEL